MIGCVPRNLEAALGARSQGIRWALTPGRKRDEAMCRQVGLSREDNPVLHSGAPCPERGTPGGHGGRGGYRWRRQLAWRSQRERPVQVGAQGETERLAILLASGLREGG